MEWIFNENLRMQEWGLTFQYFQMILSSGINTEGNNILLQVFGKLEAWVEMRQMRFIVDKCIIYYYE